MLALLGLCMTLGSTPQDGECDLFGAALVALGDVDRDGLGDLLVGDWSGRRSGSPEPAAWIFSGASGELLEVLAVGWSFCGASLIEDLDGDGVAECAVLVENGRDRRMIVHSCAKRSSLVDRRVGDDPASGTVGVVPWNDSTSAALGFALLEGTFGTHRLSALRVSTFSPLVELRDVSAPLECNAYAIVEGKNDLVLARWDERCAATELLRRDARGLHAFGELPAVEVAELASLPDFDGDGIDDVSIDIEQSAERSAVWWLSGLDARGLVYLAPFVDVAEYTLVRSISDLDGDGRAERIVTRPGWWKSVGAWCVSSATLATLWTLPAPIVAEDDWPESRFGWALATLDDLDRDGRLDFAISTCNPWAPDEYDAVRLCSGRTGKVLRKLERPWHADCSQ